MSIKITRRRFLVLGGGAGLSAFLGGAYIVSACPLSDSGVCVGPCAAYVDRLGDGLCDRAYADRARAQSVAQASGSEGAEAAEEPTLSCCPFGLVNDPYPGQCQHYIDEDGDGFCDLSQPDNVGQAFQPDIGNTPQPDNVGQAFQPDIGNTPQPQLGVACPFGLVNDPYPGQCRSYVDRNGNVICDLSEPGSGLNPPADAPETDDDEPRRRRGWGSGR